jgi:hypothetical protein
MKKEHVQLTEAHRTFLEALIQKGELKARAYRRALGLLELDRGMSFTEVAKTVQGSLASVSSWVREYRGRPILIDGQQQAKITALACSEPPKGYAQWSLR